MSFAFSHVTKRFGSVLAVDDVTMSFEPGLISAIIGPNGAGKSTLVNMAAGSYPVTSGRILLDGRRIEHLKKHQISQAGVARTYQNIRLFDQMTVLDNLEVALAPAGLRQAWREVLALGTRGRSPPVAAKMPRVAGGVWSGGHGGRPCGASSLWPAAHAGNRTCPCLPAPRAAA
jgi:ABC-type branched-subunit amino acid transport system ATPase component